MLDPSFTDDTEVAQLTRDERLFLVGCLRNADDEGRLNGHIVFLKSQIFMYDDDIDLKRMQEIKESTLKKMEGWHPDNIWCLHAYQNSGQDYIYFSNWYEFNKPSHPSPSKLPAPSDTNSSGIAQEEIQKPSGNKQEGFPKPSALGQVSQSQVSLSKVRGVQEDFTKFLDSEKDLTDFLTTTMTKHMSAGRARASPGHEAAVAAQWGMPVIEKFWTQAVGSKLPGTVWQGAYSALQKYPVDIMAKVFVKASRYQGGKHKSWKYFQAIIDEEMEKHGRSPPD